MRTMSAARRSSSSSAARSTAETPHAPIPQGPGDHSGPLVACPSGPGPPPRGPRPGNVHALRWQTLPLSVPVPTWFSREATRPYRSVRPEVDSISRGEQQPMPNQGRPPAHVPRSHHARRAGRPNRSGPGPRGPRDRASRSPPQGIRSLTDPGSHASSLGQCFPSRPTPPVRPPERATRAGSPHQSPSRHRPSRSRDSRAWSSGRKRGEYLALADNGFGSKANSVDFQLRALLPPTALQDCPWRLGGRRRQRYTSSSETPITVSGSRSSTSRPPSAAHRSGRRSRSHPAGPRRGTSGSATSSVRGSCTSAAPVSCSTLPSPSPGSPPPTTHCARARRRSPAAEVRGHVDLEEPQVPVRGLRGCERRGPGRRPVASDDPRVQHPGQGVHRPVVGLPRGGCEPPDL